MMKAGAMMIEGIMMIVALEEIHTVVEVDPTTVVEDEALLYHREGDTITR